MKAPWKDCPGCGVRTRGSECRACRNKRFVKAETFCTECNVKLSHQNKTGLCRTHALIAGSRKAWENPEYAEKMRSLAREHARKYLFQPEVRERWMQSRPDVGRKMSERALAWCPREYRAEYLRRMHSGHRNAATAKAEMLEIIEADRVARLVATQQEAAAHHLRRFTAVLRRDDGWRYGTATLTPEQLIERAIQKGWEPSEWSIAA